MITVGGVQYAFGSTADFADTVPLAMAASGAPCDSTGNCGTLAYASAFNTHDGLHPSTITQGLMANELLMYLNANLGAEIPLLTDAEILMAAVPEPGVAPLAVLGLFALWLSDRQRARWRPAGSRIARASRRAPTHSPTRSERPRPSRRLRPQ